MKDTKRYNDTLLLPKTNFEMRANLPEKEIRTLKFWEDIGLWKALREAAKGREKFILHDGPPYANGNIHMGTAFNKIIKDLSIPKRLATEYNPYFAWNSISLT